MFFLHIFLFVKIVDYNSNFDSYNCLMEKGEYKKYVIGNLISNGIHEMFIRKVNKLVLNPFDDERNYFNNIESNRWT